MYVLEKWKCSNKDFYIAEPDVLEHQLNPNDEFMVIACDGIWDCMTNQQVADFVRAKIRDKVPLKEICEDIMDECLAEQSDFGGVGCDNMSVIVVAFLQGKSLDAWYDNVAANVPDSLKAPPKKVIKASAAAASSPAGESVPLNAIAAAAAEIKQQEGDHRQQ